LRLKVWQRVAAPHDAATRLRTKHCARPGPKPDHWSKSMVAVLSCRSLVFHRRPFGSTPTRAVGDVRDGSDVRPPNPASGPLRTSARSDRAVWEPDAVGI